MAVYTRACRTNSYLHFVRGIVTATEAAVNMSYIHQSLLCFSLETPGYKLESAFNLTFNHAPISSRENETNIKLIFFHSYNFYP